MQLQISKKLTVYIENLQAKMMTKRLITRTNEVLLSALIDHEYFETPQRKEPKQKRVQSRKILLRHLTSILSAYEEGTLIDGR